MPKRKEPSLTQDARIFPCPRCGWWAVGMAMGEREGAEVKTTTERIFNVECAVSDCGWKGELPGSKGRELPKGSK